MVNAFIKKYLSWSVVTKESGTQECWLTYVGLSGGTFRRQNTVESPKGKHFKMVRGNNNIRRSYDKGYISLLQK